MGYLEVFCMSYTPTAGIITAIEYQGDGAFGGSDCTIRDWSIFCCRRELMC